MRASFAIALRPILLLTTVACLPSATEAAPSVLPKAAFDMPAPRSGQTQMAVFAAGCFWCVEAVFEELEGVTDVTSGYAGDVKAKAKYDLVSSGGTKHAEAVRVTFDERLTYGRLLEVLFSLHDPTTRDRQGPDHGTQYRSAVFYANDEQRQVASAYIQQLQAAKTFENPIVTTLEPLEQFYSAEAYHQNFVARNPRHEYVQRWAIPKIEKVRALFPTSIKIAKKSRR